MIKIPFVLCLILIAMNSLAQRRDYEEIAISYFFDSVFKKEYNVKKIEFSDSSESYLTSYRTFDDCFDKKEGIRNELNEPAVRADIQNKIFIDLNKLTNLKKRNIKHSSNRLKLFVSLAHHYNSKVYVLIEVYKKLEFTDAYMFELNKEGVVERCCKTGVLH